MAFIAALVRYRISLSDPPKNSARAAAQVGRIPGYGRGMPAVFPEAGRVFQVKRAPLADFSYDYRDQSFTPAVRK
jgi:hypothetical protein